MCVQELGEDPDTRMEKISELRQRIQQVKEKLEHKHVTFERQDDRFLLCFLRARKFNVERALQLYMNYYKFRHKHACHLKDYSVRGVEHVLRTGMFAVLDTPTLSGSKVLVIFPSRSAEMALSVLPWQHVLSNPSPLLSH